MSPCTGVGSAVSSCRSPSRCKQRPAAAARCKALHTHQQAHTHNMPAANHSSTSPAASDHYTCCTPHGQLQLPPQDHQARHLRHACLGITSSTPVQQHWLPLPLRPLQRTNHPASSRTPAHTQAAQHSMPLSSTCASSTSQSASSSGSTLTRPGAPPWSCRSRCAAPPPCCWGRT